MKKMVVVTLMITLGLMLTSCKTGNISQGDDSNEIPLLDFADIMNGNGGNQIISEFTAIEKQKIINKGIDEGIDVSFEANGSVTFKSIDGSTTKQNKEGVWTFENANGTSGQIGGEIPENELFQLIPEPDFKMLYSGEEPDKYFITFADATIEQLKEYVDLCKNSGFTINAETVDENAMTIDESLGDSPIYSYKASNMDGYTINIVYSQNMSAVLMEKP